MIQTRQFEQVTQISMSRVLDGKPLYWVAAYLVDGLLVDTGCHFTSGELLEYLRDKNVKQAVNTHFHEDHVGGNRAIMDGLGIDIYAHPGSIPLIAERPRLFPYQEFVWGYPEPTQVKPTPGTIRTDSFSFRVVETPGHSVGHVALMELSKGWCFSGDIFAREQVKFIRPEENVSGLVNSMRKILSLAGDRLVLFTSVGKIVEEGCGALSACIEHLAGLAEKVQHLSREGRTADEILDLVFGGEHNFAQITNGQYTSMNLVKSLLAME
jgi:glyoxylase-like metal-dependent hydrolase (beta-lactamase superfamily II)